MTLPSTGEKDSPNLLMRHLAVLCATLGLATCVARRDARAGPEAAASAHGPAAEVQPTSIDSVVRFLVAAAASDFKAHRPPAPARFRNVRLGHVMSAGGVEQYMLCGQFLPAQQGGRPEWIEFATIKTSGYEHWVGERAAGFCKAPAVIWDRREDLTFALQSQLDSLR
jgi:hypothetical protein